MFERLKEMRERSRCIDKKTKHDFKWKGGPCRHCDKTFAYMVGR